MKPTDEDSTASSIDPAQLSELWNRFMVLERTEVPAMLNMPPSTWDLIKRTACPPPRIFGLGRRKYMLVSDLKEFIQTQRDQWKPAPKTRRMLYRMP
jgi:hypothetical protein